jgi:hypothetical protein
MKPRARPDHPLLWAILISVVGSAGLELLKVFATHQSFPADIWDGQLAYMVGHAIPGVVSIFIPVALVLLVCRWITGAVAKAKIKAQADAKAQA